MGKPLPELLGTRVLGPSRRTSLNFDKHSIISITYDRSRDRKRLEDATEPKKFEALCQIFWHIGHFGYIIRL